MSQLKRIHLIGIGGAGMSAIAWVLLEKGIHVSGSDIRPNPRTRRLEKKGALLFYGHSPDNLENTGLVIRSTAIRDDNPEILKAKQLRIPVWHRSRMLAEFLDEGEGITIAGTHGKTTTTAMAAQVLKNAGFDPTVLIGSDLPSWNGNARLGNGRYVVAEADESDGSFLEYKPRYTIITNIEAEHLDHYKTEEGVRDAFRTFLFQVKSDGYAILCADDPGVRSILVEKPSCGIRYYSLKSSKFDYSAGEISLMPRSVAFNVRFMGKNLGRIRMPVPGLHNISNALATVALGHLLGINFFSLRDALEEFRGTHRRFQYKGEQQDVLVFDDYAHHPTEIMATLKAAIPLREKRGGRLVTIFQPHRYSRTRDLADRFAKAFRDSDLLIVSDVYPAGEEAISGVSGKLIADNVEPGRGTEVIYIPRLEDIDEELPRMVLPGDVVITMGAGDVWKVGERLLCNLKERSPETATI